MNENMSREMRFPTMRYVREAKCSDKPRQEISNNVVCARSKCSDKPAHTHSRIRAFASRLNIL